jgi:hypothetical protein
MAQTTRDHAESTPAGRKAKADTAAADTSTREVQERADRETEQGFRGVEVDPTPNEAYTVAGVTKSAPTPETDDEAAEQARKAQADTARRAAGVAER